MYGTWLKFNADANNALERAYIRDPSSSTRLLPLLLHGALHSVDLHLMQQISLNNNTLICSPLRRLIRNIILPQWHNAPIAIAPKCIEHNLLLLNYMTTSAMKGHKEWHEFRRVKDIFIQNQGNFLSAHDLRCGLLCVIQGVR